MCVPLVKMVEQGAEEIYNYNFIFIFKKYYSTLIYNSPQTTPFVTLSMRSSHSVIPEVVCVVPEMV